MGNETFYGDGLTLFWNINMAAVTSCESTLLNIEFIIRAEGSVLDARRTYQYSHPTFVWKHYVGSKFQGRDELNKKENHFTSKDFV